MKKFFMSFEKNKRCKYVFIIQYSRYCHFWDNSLRNTFIIIAIISIIINKHIENSKMVTIKMLIWKKTVVIAVVAFVSIKNKTIFVINKIKAIKTKPIMLNFASDKLSFICNKMEADIIKKIHHDKFIRYSGEKKAILILLSISRNCPIVADEKILEFERSNFCIILACS